MSAYSLSALASRQVRKDPISREEWLEILESCRESMMRIEGLNFDPLSKNHFAVNSTINQLIWDTAGWKDEEHPKPKAMATRGLLLDAKESARVLKVGANGVFKFAWLTSKGEWNAIEIKYVCNRGATRHLRRYTVLTFKQQECTLSELLRLQYSPRQMLYNMLYFLNQVTEIRKSRFLDAYDTFDDMYGLTERIRHRMGSTGLPMINRVRK